jgi:hypothetical protein
MGQRGGSFTDADLYVAAKYVATFPAFDEASARERWEPYGERVGLLRCLIDSSHMCL